MMAYKTIFFPTDFSEGSEEVFSHALSLAARYGGTLHLLHVVHQIADISGFYVPHISFDVIEREMEESARKNMEKFCEERIGETVPFRIHTRKGTPFVEIIRAARELEADLIVMGTHGRSGIEHILFGSTAEKVVRKSPIPVLTVRPAGRAFVMP